MKVRPTLFLPATRRRRAAAVAASLPLVWAAAGAAARAQTWNWTGGAGVNANGLYGWGDARNWAEGTTPVGSDATAIVFNVPAPGVSSLSPVASTTDLPGLTIHSLTYGPQTGGWFLNGPITMTRNAATGAGPVINDFAAGATRMGLLINLTDTLTYNTGRASGARIFGGLSGAGGIVYNPTVVSRLTFEQGSSFTGGLTGNANARFGIQTSSGWGSGAVTLANDVSDTVLYFGAPSAGALGIANSINLSTVGGITSTFGNANGVPVTLAGVIGGGSAAARTVLRLSNDPSVTSLGNFRFTNAANDFRATVEVNTATLSITSDGALGAAGNGLRLTTGTLYLDASDLVLNRAIETVQYSTGTVTAAGTARLDGLISGGGTFAVEGGTVTLTNSANRIESSLIAYGGTLRVAGDMRVMEAQARGGTLALAASLTPSTALPLRVFVGDGGAFRFEEGGATAATISLTSNRNGTSAVSGLEFAAGTAAYANDIRFQASASASTNAVDFRTNARENQIVTLGGLIRQGDQTSSDASFRVRFLGTASGSSGVVLTNAANAFRGTLEVAQGTLGFTSDAALGNAANSVRLFAGFSGQGTGGLRFEADGITLARAIDVGFAAGPGVVTLDTRGNDATISGVVSSTNGGVSARLAKVGAGTLTLSNAAHTYAGTLRVDGGALLVNGNLPAALTTVNAGGTLGGEGTLRAITMNAGGTLAPGAVAAGYDTGTLSASSLSVASGATLNFDLGTVSDRIALTGGLTFGSAAAGSGTVAGFAFADAGGLTAGQTYTLITFSSQTATPFLGNVAAVGRGNLSNIGGRFDIVSLDSSRNALTYTVFGFRSASAEIPEPGALALAVPSGILAAAVRGARRRRRRP